MLRITEWQTSTADFGVITDQINKYNPGMAVVRELDGWYAVYRSDMVTPKTALKEHCEVNKIEKSSAEIISELKEEIELLKLQLSTQK